MSTRARWTVAGVAFALALCIAAIYWLTTNVKEFPVHERGPKTWVIDMGETRRLLFSQVRPDDRYRCPGQGIIDGTPDRGVIARTGEIEDFGPGGLSVATAEDGSVMVACAPTPVT